jgi:hypothetical protein
MMNVSRLIVLPSCRHALSGPRVQPTRSGSSHSNNTTGSQRLFTTMLTPADAQVKTIRHRHARYHTNISFAHSGYSRLLDQADE